MHGKRESNLSNWARNGLLLNLKSRLYEVDKMTEVVALNY